MLDALKRYINQLFNKDYLLELQENWEVFGQQDAMWSILTDPSKKNNKWDIQDFFTTGSHEIQSVFSHINDELKFEINYGKALDFGCGIGRVTQALCCYFQECYGVDIAESMIELAKQYNQHKDKCYFYQNNTNDLSQFDNNFFDFVYSRIVLQHIKPEYSKQYIKEFLRILSPGGLIVFQVPSEPVSNQERPYFIPQDYKSDITVSPASMKILSKAKTSSTIVLEVKVKNTGNAYFPSFNETQGKFFIALGNHWLNSQGKVVIFDDGRSPLQAGLQPMQETKIELIINTPSKKGEYLLELDLVHEGVTWFSEQGNTKIRIPIFVDSREKECNNSNSNLSKKKNQSKAPKMEMYSVPQKDVIQLIQSNQGKIVDIQPDFSTGGEWKSFLYFVSK
ncbi:MAG: class I SAM-dependent methyltransferase [Bacteroidota bacterium]